MADNSKFVRNVLTEKQAAGRPSEVRVHKLEGQAAPTVKSFTFQPLSTPDRKDYQEIKKKYGALALTDPEKVARTKADSKFMLNPLVREPLGVADEERRVIEQYVEQRVAALSQQVSDKAEKVGYQAGLQKGYQEAFAQFQKESAGRLEGLKSMVEEAEGAKDAIFLANERYLIDLIYRISKMILLKELKVDREYLVRLTKEIVERAGVRENIRIRISEEDGKTMDILKMGLEKSFGHIKNLEIQVSPEVKQGGCIVETEWNAVDASLDRQFEGIYDALFATGSEKSA